MLIKLPNTSFDRRYLECPTSPCLWNISHINSPTMKHFVCSIYLSLFHPLRTSSMRSGIMY
uniref:Uncharacterized protein n=2 Tax=Physcomitrium patens TaxID=3218 RepID=A0A2K1IUJ2_PHYPA|nr:hypothetical protein PHYPA_024896 [Physcomitrium patens]